jgi:hypothetical protein
MRKRLLTSHRVGMTEKTKFVVILDYLVLTKPVLL